MLLESISLFWNSENTLQENMGYLIHLFLFLGEHQSSHCFQYLGHLSIFLISFFLFMNNFCIAPYLFSATKLLRDSNKNLEYLFGRYPIGHIFGVHSQCRSKIFLDGSRWNGIFLRLPPVQEQCICGWCVRDLDFKSMINLS